MKTITLILATIFVIGGIAYSLNGASIDPEYDMAMDFAKQIHESRIEKRASDQPVDTHKVLVQMRALDTMPAAKKNTLYEKNFFFVVLPKSEIITNDSIASVLRSEIKGAKNAQLDFMYAPFDEGVITKDMLLENPSYRVKISNGKYSLFQIHPATGETHEVKVGKQEILSRLCKVIS